MRNKKMRLFLIATIISCTAFSGVSPVIASAQETVAIEESNPDIIQDNLSDDPAEDAREAVEKAKILADQAEADEAAAKQAFDDAREKTDQAEAQVAQAYADAKDAIRAAKETASENAESANSNLESAKMANDEAAKKYQSASAADEDAATALNSAIGLKNGTIDISDTAQYKEAEEAKDVLNTATDEQNTITARLSQAETVLLTAVDDLEEKTTVLKNKKSELQNKEEALNAAVKEKSQADTEVTEYQKAYDSAKSNADKANADLATAEQNKENAEAESGRAQADKETVDAQLLEAEKNLEDVTNNAESTVEQQFKDQISAAETDVDEAQKVLDQANAELIEATEVYNQGMLGFIDWMLEKPDLEREAKKDLEKARAALLAATEEDLSSLEKYTKYDLAPEREGKTVVIGDNLDSTSIENIKKAIGYLYQINEYRATDDNYTGVIKPNPAYTNFYSMVFAQIQAMRSASCLNHTNTTGVTSECLHFGSVRNPVDGWYSEKELFDKAKAELEIDIPASYNETNKITTRAGYSNVGHYTSLLSSQNQVMGVGYTQYAGTSASSTTTSYDAFSFSEKTDQRLRELLGDEYDDYDGYGKIPFLYTIADFEALFNEYLATINMDTLQNAYDNAASDLEQAKAALESLKNNRDQMIANLIKDAKDNLSEKQAAAQTAQTNLDNAKTAEKNANEAFTKAVTNKENADAELETANTALNNAIKKAQQKEEAVEAATAARDNAKTDVANAESAYNKAVTAKDEAQTTVDNLTADKAEADKAVEAAKAAYETAAQKLADLMSEETIGKLREEKDKTAEALAQAAAEKKEAETALSEAEANQTAAEAVLKVVNEYSVESLMAEPSSDSDYQCLNEYVDKIKSAEDALTEAQEALDNATNDLTEKQEANKAAQEAYLEALGVLSDLEIKEAWADLCDTLDAIEKDYREIDYTPESYAVLEKAIEEAEKTLSKTQLTLEEIQNAKEKVINAVNALKLAVITGWQQEDGYWYYYNEDGTKVVSQWKKDSKGWCWLQADGKMLTNGWAKDSKGWCYIGDKGYMVEKTQWVKVSGSWYHITNGYRDQSKWMKDSKGWCYLGTDGKMVTNGWAKDSKGWCWMGADGYWVSNKWIQSGGQWYYIKSNHYMAANEWAKDAGGWMYMDANGKITKNKWVKSGGYWYYLKANGYMATGTLKISGKTYKFDSAGRWVS